MLDRKKNGTALDEENNGFNNQDAEYFSLKQSFPTCEA